MFYLLMGWIVFGWAAVAAPDHVAGGVQPAGLTCEYLVSPVGIDAMQPRLAWSLTAPARPRGQAQTAYQVLVAGDAKMLAADHGDLWDSGRVASDSVQTVYAGRALESYEQCFWKVRVWDRDGTPSEWSSPASWSMGILNTKFWQARWLRYAKVPPPSAEALAGAAAKKPKPWGQKFQSPRFRKTFELAKPVARATATICGLGYYELRINGTKVGDRVLDPLYTRYDRRHLYATYEVADCLTPGKNAIGVMLGNGFYNPHAKDVWYFEKSPWRDEPVLRFQLRVQYADGTIETIASDAAWRASTGPLMHDGVRNGEVYDARLETPGWDTAAFDDSPWAAPQLVDGPRGALCAEAAPPIRIMQTITPVGVKETRPGVFVFDMGQNFAGWAQLKVSGPAGTTVTMRYGERINAAGNLERETIDVFVHQGPFQTDTYILSGRGKEVYEPRFTYHGFRWVEVTGFPGRPTLDSLRGRVVHTAFRPTGSFECSNELLNKIQQATLWSYRSNFVGIPTDCPQREKNGWTGDAHLAAEQAMYNFDNVAGYEKWMNDLKDEQRESGELPGIVPTSGWGYEWGNGPAWDSAYVLIPWYLYRYYGDTRVLADHYDRMKRYVDYLTRRSKNHIVDIGLGDWVPAKTQTPVSVTSTGYYYVDAIVVSRAAKLLGREDDAKKYAELAETTRTAFNKTFCPKPGVVANGSQTALSCALYQGLARPDHKEPILATLVADVDRKAGHLDTGILGAKYLLHALTDNGRPDVAYRIVTQTTRPSYGDWIARGATTLWEDWDDGSSRNHIMFGDISAWFYQTLAGLNLDPEVPAFKRFIVRPRPVGDLRWVRAKHESPYGPIAVSWKRDDGEFSLDVTVPPSTSAVVYVPAKSADTVREGGQPAAQAPGVKFLRHEDGAAVFEVGSGAYAFSAH